jgi:hypothetical protein
MAEPKPQQVVPMPRKPPHPGVLLKLIRALVEAGAVSFSKHAFEDRSGPRSIDFTDALEILRRGHIKGDITPGERAGEWKCKVIDQLDRSSRWVGVPVVVIKDERILIITVEWEDTK